MAGRAGASSRFGVRLACLTAIVGACQAKESSPSGASTRPATTEPLAASSASASAGAVASGSVPPAAPVSTPTKEPSDPRARIAHWYTLSQLGVQGMPTWPDKYFDTAAMREYQTDCDAGKRESCTLAAHGFYRRSLYPLMHKYLFRACEAKEPAACGFYLVLEHRCRQHASASPGTAGPQYPWCDALDLPPLGEDTPADYVRVARELCEAELPYGCAYLPELDDTLDSNVAGEIRMRACELGSAGACRSGSVLRIYPPIDETSPRYQAAARAFCTVHQDATSCAWWGEVGLKDSSLVRAACAMTGSMTWESRLCDVK